MSNKHDKHNNNPFKNAELDKNIENNEASVEETAEEIKKDDKNCRKRRKETGKEQMITYGTNQYRNSMAYRR